MDTIFMLQSIIGISTASMSTKNVKRTGKQSGIMGEIEENEA